MKTVMMEKRIKLTIIASVISTILLVGLYFIVFNGQLSNNSSDWANFGSYISGIGTLVFSFLNVWIFYKLTCIIHDKDSVSREKEEAERRRKERLESIYRSFDSFDNAIADAYRNNLSIDKRMYDISRIDLAYLKLNDLAELNPSNEEYRNHIYSIAENLRNLKKLYQKAAFNASFDFQMDGIKQDINDHRGKMKIILLFRQESGD